MGWVGRCNFYARWSRLLLCDQGLPGAYCRLGARPTHLPKVLPRPLVHEKEVAWHRKQSAVEGSALFPQKEAGSNTGVWVQEVTPDKGQEIPGQSSGPTADCLSRFPMFPARPCGCHHCRTDGVPPALSSETTGSES